MSDVVGKKHEPIVHLVVDLQMSGGDLLEIAGYLTALHHLRELGGRERWQIDKARKAIAKASAALDAFEAAATEQKEAA